MHIQCTGSDGAIHSHAAVSDCMLVDCFVAEGLLLFCFISLCLVCCSSVCYIMEVINQIKFKKYTKRQVM